MKDYANKKNLFKEVAGKPRPMRAAPARPAVQAAKSPGRKASKNTRRWLRWVVLAVLVAIVLNGVVHIYKEGDWRHFVEDKKAALVRLLHREKAPVVRAETTKSSPDADKSNNAGASAQNASVGAGAASTPAPAPPQFDFYTVLPSRTVAVTDGSSGQTAGTGSSGTTTTATNSTKQFVLQVASYQNAQDADKMRAQLLLMGLSPTISQSDSGWYRVDLGPFNSARDADVVRHKIQKANINGAMLRQIS